MSSDTPARGAACDGLRDEPSRGESLRDEALRELMRAAQDGDRDAYERLLRQIIPFIRARARRYCRNPSDIEELVQETLLTVHRVRHTYDPRRPFLPWLAAIAARRAIDAARRRGRIGRHEGEPLAAMSPGVASEPVTAADVAEAHAAAAADGSRLEELLRRLPARQRQAVQVLKLEEMSLAEASLATGQSVGALKVNVHRALRRLRGWVSTPAGKER